MSCFAEFAGSTGSAPEWSPCVAFFSLPSPEEGRGRVLKPPCKSRDRERLSGRCDTSVSSILSSGNEAVAALLIIESLCRFAFGSFFSWLSSSGKINRARPQPDASIPLQLPTYSISQQYRRTRFCRQSTLRSQRPTGFCGVGACLVSCSPTRPPQSPTLTSIRHKILHATEYSPVSPLRSYQFCFLFSP